MDTVGATLGRVLPSLTLIVDLTQCGIINAVTVSVHLLAF
jgi:hypothetical protein